MPRWRYGKANQKADQAFSVFVFAAPRNRQGKAILRSIMAEGICLNSISFVLDLTNALPARAFNGNCRNGCASQMMRTEVSGKIGADIHEQSQTRESHRCGFRSRRPDNRPATKCLMVHKVRKGGHVPFVFPERKYSKEARAQVVRKAFVNGVSTRMTVKLAKSPGIEGISPIKAAR